MIQVSAREAREKWADMLNSAQAGQTIEVMRRGKTVARIVPPLSAQARKLPDLTVFHKTLKMAGKPMSRTVIEERRKARY